MNEETKPKKPIKLQQTTSDSERIKTLEKVIAEMAHYNGTQRILDKYGIPRWTPGKDDMSKRRD